MNYDYRVITFINDSYQVRDLLKGFYNLDVGVGDKFLCPFHRDNKNSAQLFGDNHFFCYAERIQYNPFKILIASGVSYDEMAKLTPVNYVSSAQKVRLFDGELYKQLVFTFSKAFQRDHNIVSVIDNWISVMKNDIERDG